LCNLSSICDCIMSEEVPRSLQRSVAGTLIDLVDEDEVKIYRSAAGKAPAPPSIDLYDLDGDEEEEMEEVDEEIVEHDRGQKREFQTRMICGEEYENHDEPDLAEYFDQFDLDETQVIAVCRTYANYLAQRVRSRWGNVKKLKVAEPRSGKAPWTPRKGYNGSKH